MKNTIQLTVQQLENILLTAKQELRLNSDCANTIEIEQLKECNTHLGGDQIKARIKSKFAECNSFEIY